LKPHNNKIDNFSNDIYQKNANSQSMIATNNSDIGKRKSIGLLEGMARKVNTNFK